MNRYLILSDLHLCDVEDHPDGWKDYKSSRYRFDGELADLVRDAVRGRPEGVPFTLVLNGDVFDFDLVTAVPGIKFGLAFCEASGAALVRWSGTDEAMIALAKQNALALGAGHSFIVFLGEGFYPVNVLNALKMAPEVTHIFCATANAVDVILAETEQGRGILGVIDGVSPKGVEDDEGIAWRKNFLRMIGYKF